MGKKSASRKRSNGGIALWQAGLLLIIGGAVANVFSPMIMGLLPPPGNHDEAMGRAFGRGLATVMCIIIGVVLIVVHFVRRRK
jgi:hypothetical protein